MSPAGSAPEFTPARTAFFRRPPPRGAGPTGHREDRRCFSADAAGCGNATPILETRYGSAALAMPRRTIRAFVCVWVFTATVTALPPEGGSFSSCRSSLTRAQPGPGSNVPRRVHVGIHRAVNGADDGILLRAVASSSAAVAADAGPGRVHQFHPPASFCRFAGEDGGELRPARIQDRPVQPGLGAGTAGKEFAGAFRVRPGRGTPGHPGRVQVLPARSRRTDATAALLRWLPGIAGARHYESAAS